jgi:hypothetical protein
MPRRAAGGSRRWSELRAGLTRVGGLEDFAAGAEVVGRGFSLAGAVGAEGQGLRARAFRRDGAPFLVRGS